MKLHFLCNESELDAIGLVCENIGVTVTSAADADVNVTVENIGRRTVEVTLRGASATIRYGDGLARMLRGVGILADALKAGRTLLSIVENPIFRTNGSMVDMSRNAVMKVDTVKSLLRVMALMGLNTFMLYTEDTYELDGYPYFGYMRGRYTKEELREIDAYAGRLGIELIPCIQMLGHLATHLKWGAAAPYRDTANTLLVGADETYRLLERMLDTVAECFTSKRIHVGMDETHDLGTCAYLERFGYKNRTDIYFEHLKRVIKLCRDRSFEPMMWSDMFFRLAGKGIEGFYDYHPDVKFTDDVISKIPEGIGQVFWDYYHPEEEFYAVNIEKHKAIFKGDTMFAGAVLLCSGHCPLYSRSLDFTIPALDACRKGGVGEVICTLWNDGSEAMPIMGFAGLAWFADYDYKGGFDEESAKTCFERATGASYDDIIACDCLEPREDEGRILSLTRPFLYNDPLVGLIDKHLENYAIREHFEWATRKLLGANGNKGIFAPACEVILKLSSLLENKTDFGIRLKAAYDNSDRETLAKLLAECDVIIEKIVALKDTHREAWMTYNKPFGWEIHDIRYGGLISRFETVKLRVDQYLSGEIESIAELEERRLRLDGEPEDSARFNQTFLWYEYASIASASRW